MMLPVGEEPHRDPTPAIVFIAGKGYGFCMEVNRERRVDAGSSTVELLPGVASAPARSAKRSRRSWRIGIAPAVVAVLYVGFLLAPTYEDVTLARLYTTEVHFGDPFDIDWIELQGAPDPDTEFSRLLPMVGGDPPCVGFGRPDWPADRRHPSVARCVDADSIDRLVGPDVVGIREIVAGVETWYFLFLSAAIADLEARLNDGSMLGSDRIYQGGSFAAILVPTGTPDIALTWRLGVGGAYRCTIDLAADGPPTCA